jgi:hypothetical protein
VNSWRDIPSEAALHAHLARQGAAVRPLQAGTRPQTPQAPVALTALFQQIQSLARRHGWKGQYTYNAHGPDTGLHVILVRTRILFAEVTLDKRLTVPQQGWIDALVTTGQVEVYVWGPEDLDAITQRLQRPRAKEIP